MGKGNESHVPAHSTLALSIRFNAVPMSTFYLNFPPFVSTVRRREYDLVLPYDLIGVSNKTAFIRHFFPFLLPFSGPSSFELRLCRH